MRYLTRGWKEAGPCVANVPQLVADWDEFCFGLRKHPDLGWIVSQVLDPQVSSFQNLIWMAVISNKQAEEINEDIHSNSR